MIKPLSYLTNMSIKSGESGFRSGTFTRRLFAALTLTVLLCLFTLPRVTAAEPEPVAAKKVTLSMRNATLTEVFNEIKRQTRLVFVSNADDMKNASRTNAEYRNATVTAVLDDLLKNQNLGYKITADYVTIFKKEAPSTKEGRSSQVSGRVVSAAGEPMVGVTVLEKGTNNGVITTVDGQFSLKLSKPDGIVLFSMLSYREQEITPPHGQKNITITMEELFTSMDEVVVVAYGTQRKSSVTGSISTVSSKELMTVSSPNVNTMLQGKVAGVQVINTSGRPGEAAKIRIRGKSSLGGESTSDPLWVVDGVISGTGSQLNPNDIETISILKDASATALYGSRATNGVILVTTKSGRMGENRMDVNVKFGLAQRHLGNFKLMGGEELYNYTMSMDRLPTDSWLYDREKLLSHDTNWYDFATQNGFSGNYTLSYTMGTDRVRNFLSGDYYRETGTMRGYTYERFTIRDNIDIKVTDRFNVHFRVAGSYWNDDNQQHDTEAAMTYLPWDYPYNPDGSIRTGKESDWHGRDAKNYLYNTNLNWARGKELGINGTFAFDYRITDWLTFESNNNIGYKLNRTEEYTDPKAIGAEVYHGGISNSTYLVTTRYTNQLLRFNLLHKERHLFSAFVGYEFSDYFYENTTAEGRSIPAGSEVLGVAAEAYAVGGTKYGNAMQSVYFNANYTYNDRYNAQISFRTDGSSKFGPQNRYGNFWTAGAGWSINKEEFMKDVKWVDHLKLRGSYGLIGSQLSLGNYSYMSTYSLSLAYNGIPAAFPNVLGNNRLTWEKCYEANVAIDARLFDRLGLVVDFYHKNTSDLLYSAPLSSLSGFTSQYQNVGSLVNKGIEITLSPDLIRTKDWNWTMDINFGLNRNKITSLANNDKDQINGNYIFRVGEDRDTFYLPEWAGVDVYTGQPLWYEVAQDGEKTLTSEYSKATKVLAGSAAPKWFGGIQTSISYKNFTLSAVGSFVFGNKIFHYARQFYDNDGAYPTYNSMSLKSGTNWKRWEKPGDIATHPQAIWGGNSNSNQASTRYIEDGSYFRLNNVTLNYDLPKRWLSKIRMSRAQVYVTGENLFTITKFSGADVEVGIGKDNGISGLDVYPSARRFTFGLNLSF